MPKCRRCGAEIMFIRLRSGKYNPVDPCKRTIIQDGGKEVLITETGEIIRGTFASYDDGANGSGYISHFSTCPFADNFRRNKS